MLTPFSLSPPPPQASFFFWDTLSLWEGWVLQVIKCQPHSQQYELVLLDWLVSTSNTYYKQLYAEKEFCARTCKPVTCTCSSCVHACTCSCVNERSKIACTCVLLIHYWKLHNAQPHVYVPYSRKFLWI